MNDVDKDFEGTVARGLDEMLLARLEEMLAAVEAKLAGWPTDSWPDLEMRHLHLRKATALKLVMQMLREKEEKE